MNCQIRVMKKLLNQKVNRKNSLKCKFIMINKNNNKKNNFFKIIKKRIFLLSN